MRVVLVPLSVEVARAAADPDAFERLTGARLGTFASNIRDIAAQDEAHNARSGRPPEWGGFIAVDDEARDVVGVGGYVTAPDETGAVEIAYHTFPPFEGRGVATAIAGALIERAAASGARLVYAHTLPETNASTRILTRHGFAQTGTAHDDDEGEVWRWERRLV